MRMRMLIGVAVLGALGCGSGPGEKIVPVSGTVSLNGQPLANATVSFQPITPPKASVFVGPGSTGQTNEKGEFTLVVMAGKPGAVVGKHRVLITSLAQKPADDDDDRRDKPRGGVPLMDKIPERYGLGQKDELSFEVPPTGTDKANFLLTSP